MPMNRFLRLLLSIQLQIIQKVNLNEIQKKIVARERDKYYRKDAKSIKFWCVCKNNIPNVFGGWTGYRIGSVWIAFIWTRHIRIHSFLCKMNGSSAPNMSFVHLIRNIGRYMTCTLLFCAWCWTAHSQMSIRLKVFRCVQCSVCLQFILLPHLSRLCREFR